MSLILCPCGGYGTATHYHDCCEPYHCGQRSAANPEVLMRSRYSAFALERFDYLTHTWAEQTRPVELTAEDNPKWIGLQILSARVNPPPKQHLGKVHFKAFCEHSDGERYCLEERSHFIKVHGLWYYVDGKSSFSRA